MNHLRGLPREQELLLPEAAEDYVAAEAPVRFIDAFADTLDLRLFFNILKQKGAKSRSWKAFH
jgi:hypothetical protein